MGLGVGDGEGVGVTVGLGVGDGEGDGVGVGPKFGWFPCVGNDISDSRPAIPLGLNVLTVPPGVTMKMGPL